ncbi:hypothetical protein ACP70R_017687 [Stipagrostis hirtigluma subsp. patula]
MADKCFSLPDDALVGILQRLPVSAQRRLRLVCRRWRDVVDERAPEQRRLRAKALAFFSKRGESRAIVFDDTGPAGRRARDWTFRSPRGIVGVVHMVGTCNGLLCLHETAPFGDGRVSVVTVANPITGEKQVLPPPVPKTASDAHGLYCFGYHPTTGQYKVVHVRPELDAVQVFTLGGTSWREVPVLAAGATTCNRSSGVVTVDGTTYWLTARTDRVVALDLKDESVTSFDAPPAVRPIKTPPQAACHLTNVQARLGVAVTWYGLTATRVEVWVLDGGRQRPRWSRRYSIVEPTGRDQGRWITAPHFTHGEYVLKRYAVSGWLYRGKVGDLIEDNKKNNQLIKEAKLILNERIYGGLTTFAYVETREPLPSING